ncbi:MAG: cysteine--tRNA ligase [Thermoproteota archaeon]
MKSVSKVVKQKFGPVRIFNTMSRKKEVIKPLKDRRIGLYTCGLTVYDYAHIGNLRTYCFEDLLRRVLEYNGYRVKHVMNITDVGHLTSDADVGEDKMVVGAHRERKTAWEIADFYSKKFFEDIDTLNIEHPHIVAKATDHIRDMIKLIKRLERKGFTYIIDDGVYFDTLKFKGYGELAKLKLGGLMPGARIDVNLQKRSPYDFALWKFSPKDSKRDMEWDSPWGVGFPGWHIECSAMSMRYLGESFDIHCGGIDHIPIHHTNEIAQSEAATGKRFVKYWVHGAHLIVEGKRMAKSLGNYYTLKDIIDKGYDPMSLRFFFLQAHYRSQLNFTFPALDAAQSALNSIYDFMRRLRAHKEGRRNTKLIVLTEKLRRKFVNALNDDLNSPRALAYLFDYMKRLNKLMDEGKIGRMEARVALRTMLELDRLLGLNLKRVLEEERLPMEVEDLIKEREEARRRKEYAKADAIRERLRGEFGIILEDAKEGVRWKKIR